MNDFNAIVAALGGIVLVLGLLSRWLERSPLPAPLLALAIGVLLGPQLLSVLDLEALGNRPTILEKAARLTLGIGLVGIALRVPREFPRRHWRTLLVLLGIGMPLMWGISTLLAYLILGLPFWLSALIGAILTPTDPIASSPVVTGPTAEANLSEELRHTISLESGANDGLGYLFVFLPLLMLTRPPGEAIERWLAHTLLWQVGVATAVGLALGWAAGKLLEWAEAHDAIEDDWRLIYTVSLALFTVGIGRVIGSDEVLMVFAAGMAFTEVVTARERHEEERGQEAVNRFFAIPMFILLGAALPWDGWRLLGWRGVLLAAAVLLLRRIPVLLLLRPWLGTVHGVPAALFVGWFGPIAIAAVYYASLVEHRLGQPVVWHVVSLVICVAAVAFGTTAAPFTRWYGRITAANRSRDAGREAAGALG